MKNLKIYIIGSLFCVIAFTQCNKDEPSMVAFEDGITLVTNESENFTLLYFEDEEEFDLALEKVVSMSESERSEWEKSINFKSFNTMSTEFYKNLNIESFQNVEELEKYVDECQFLQLFERDGEIYLETKLFLNKKRFISNVDRLYQIGGNVYKVFENDVAFTSIENIELLKQTCNLDNLNPLIQIKQNKNIVRSATKYDVWESKDGFQGSNKTYVWVCLELLSWHIDQQSDVRLCWEVRPYNKTLGIWFYCSRTCHFQWDVTVTVGLQNYKMQGYCKDETSLFTRYDKVSFPYLISSFSQYSMNVVGWTNSTPNDKCIFIWLSKKRI